MWQHPSGLVLEQLLLREVQGSAPPLQWSSARILRRQKMKETEKYQIGEAAFADLSSSWFKNNQAGFSVA